MEGSSGSDAPFSDDEFLSTGTEELNSTRTQGHKDYGIDANENQEVCPDVHKMQLNNAKLRYSDAVRSRRGTNSHGSKDQGVFHPQRTGSR